MICIEAEGISKASDGKQVLDGFDLIVERGSVVGLVGRNGAGKTTALRAIAGLTQYKGHLRVLGREPYSERARLMDELTFIADVAVLPRWMRVKQLLDYVAGVHRRFDRSKCLAFIQTSGIDHRSRINDLSKGMVAQLHLAVAMSIGADVLILDEPTLGLDAVYRKAFFDALVADYLDSGRTILIASHQIEEIQNLLTHIVFITHGRTVLAGSVNDIDARYAEVSVRPDQVDAARLLCPVHEREGFGLSVMTFEQTDPAVLEHFGSVRAPTLADLFIALESPASTMGNDNA
jgi:ABC-2 type transport system ATP-binding protein